MTLSLPKSGVQYLVGSPEISTQPLSPYSPMVCEFLDRLATELRKDKEAAKYPDVMTFSFWCRRANLEKLQGAHGNSQTRLGLGVAFHIAPSNVPVNFAFTFVFGALAGNANIIRVPSKSFPQVDIICRAINTLFADEKFAEIKKMTAFVRYEANDEITSQFSSACRARVIWGGDETIQKIKKLPLPVRGQELSFPDRYSLCVISTDAIATLSDNERIELAKKFYNDTYLMDQNACSSPHLVVWTGSKNEAAKEKFWEAINKVAEKKYDLQPSHAIDKYLQFCEDAIELTSAQEFRRYGNFLYVVALHALHFQMQNLRGKYGYFFEYQCANLNELASVVTDKYQTLTYFGIDKKALLQFVLENRVQGIDRIVEIGKALDIGVMWDGYDVIRSLSRVIDIHG